MGFKVSFHADVPGSQATVRKWGAEKIAEISDKYADDLRQTLSEFPTRTGKKYVRDGRIHVAAAPGEPPTPFTGALRDSIQSTHVRTTRTKVQYAVFSDKHYAVELELGIGSMTYHGERPAWITTLFENVGSYQSIITSS